MFMGNATVLRGSVTANIGTIPANSRADTTAVFANAAVGDRVFCSPAVVNASASVGTVESPAVTTAGIITVSTLNAGTNTVAAGTAVVHNVTLFKNTGEDNIP